MPIVFEANFDGSDTVRYFQISLVRLYLDQAHKYATDSKNEGVDRELVSSITSIMFSAMALEAFVNEISEDVIEKDNLDNFIRLRAPYKMKSGEGSICAKIRILFDTKFKYSLEGDSIRSVIELANFRNSLVHYKLTDTAGKIIMPPVKHMPLEGGGVMSTIDFMVEPKRVEPPFVDKINSKSAAAGFNTAMMMILKWGELMGVEDFVPGLSVIA